ncbi:hypothetical protein [Demequina activiva]|uniref:Uncharacterized protein n=1 Tax=Demequina activiva TaxID=1582364 RepID=A0A919Q3S0_9MICO|nr:hypothetical protein [Demequina activiva]GIG53763.1 hypothetical protein Dac01nite_05150 [Demequina activiva]
MVGTAWATPAIILGVAVPRAAASTTAGIIDIVVTPSGNEDEIDATVVIPDGESITDILVTVTWSSQPAGSGVSVGPDLGWQPSATSDEVPVATFSSNAVVDSSGVLVISIVKGQSVAGDDNDFTIRIDATHVQTGTRVFSEASGDYT